MASAVWCRCYPGCSRQAANLAPLGRATSRETATPRDGMGRPSGARCGSSRWGALVPSERNRGSAKSLFYCALGQVHAAPTRACGSQEVGGLPEQETMPQCCTHSRLEFLLAAPAPRDSCTSPRHHGQGTPIAEGLAQTCRAVLRCRTGHRGQRNSELVHHGRTTHQPEDAPSKRFGPELSHG